MTPRRPPRWAISRPTQSLVKLRAEHRVPPPVKSNVVRNGPSWSTFPATIRTGANRFFGAFWVARRLRGPATRPSAFGCISPPPELASPIPATRQDGDSTAGLSAEGVHTVPTVQWTGYAMHVLSRFLSRSMHVLSRCPVTYCPVCPVTNPRDCSAIQVTSFTLTR